MGMSKLNEIVAIFQKRGQRRNPVAIIQNGTPEEK
jgi:siroheme synthase